MEQVKSSDGLDPAQPGRRRAVRVLAVVLAVIIMAPLLALVFSYAVIKPNQAYILDIDDTQPAVASNSSVGIVLGSGITADGRPYRELQSRLDTAAEALKKGRVSKLVLSGDNRFDGYNEPQAMTRYLHEQKSVPLAQLQEDFAGRSTYESCERAAKVFGLDSAIIFSAGSHLPRAIFLCRQFGIEAYGIASQTEANNAQRREAVARVKAIFNVYINGENTILGEPIKL